MRSWLLALAACTHAAGSSASGGFRVFYPDTQTKVGKHFQAKPSADCKYDNGNDARWAASGARVKSGELPPGLTIEDAAIAGVPKQAGSYQVKLVVTGVTCAGKELPDQEVDVAITVR
jgi:hypothetical protein